MTITYLTPGIDRWLTYECSTKRGAVNAYKCESCGFILVVRHADAGVTPMFMPCRSCGETAGSAGYPDGPMPTSLAVLPRWVWYRPDDTEYGHQTTEVQDYLRNGGLLLRAPEPTN